MAVQIDKADRKHSAIEQIKSAPDLGPSYFPNILEQMEELGSVEFAAIRLGPTPWWNTRVHLVPALASDFPEIRQSVLLAPDGPSADSSCANRNSACADQRAAST
jgi:hypothetical protein